MSVSRNYISSFLMFLLTLAAVSWPAQLHGQAAANPETPSDDVYMSGAVVQTKADVEGDLIERSYPTGVGL